MREAVTIKGTSESLCKMEFKNQFIWGPNILKSSPYKMCFKNFMKDTQYNKAMNEFQ